MSQQLDNFLVTLGVKGQNVVLATMDNIRKKGKDISKSKIVANLAAKGGMTRGAAASAPEQMLKEQHAENERVKKTHRQEADKEEKSDSKFREAAGKFGQGVQNFASAASTLDPVSVISSVTSAIGTSLSGIEVLGVGLGELPKGIAQITNSTLAMAKASLDMAKQATAANYALVTRNAAASHYGGAVGQGQLSNNERAMLIDAVSGSMGRIQLPLAAEINKLIGTKDTRALARVGAGDWESTGEDKGWMIGQMMNGVQGLPPSIKQKIQASMLSKNSDLIQNNADGQVSAQSAAGTFANLDEAHTKALYDKAAPGGQIDGRLITAQSGFYKMQEGIYDAGLSFTKGIVDAVAELKTLAGEVTRVKDALKKIPELISHPSMANAKQVGKSIAAIRPER